MSCVKFYFCLVYALFYFCNSADPAKVVKLASEQKVAVQQNVILHCEAEGNPQPTYTWTPCNPQGQVCYESTLNISNVLNDSVYSCKVTNLLGNDTRNTSVGKLIRGNEVMSNCRYKVFSIAHFVKNIEIKSLTTFNITARHTMQLWFD